MTNQNAWYWQGHISICAQNLRITFAAKHWLLCEAKWGNAVLMLLQVINHSRLAVAGIDRVCSQTGSFARCAEG